MGRRRWMLALVAAAVGVIAPGAGAHPTLSSAAMVSVRPGGAVELTLHIDALAFLLNDTSQNIADAPMYELLDGPDAALEQAIAEGRERFLSLVGVLVDDARIP